MEGSGWEAAMRTKKDVAGFQSPLLKEEKKNTPFERLVAHTMSQGRQPDFPLNFKQYFSKLATGILSGTTVYCIGLFHTLRGLWGLQCVLCDKQHARNTKAIKHTSMHFKTFLR